MGSNPTPLIFIFTVSFSSHGHGSKPPYHILLTYIIFWLLTRWGYGFDLQWPHLFFFIFHNMLIDLTWPKLTSKFLNFDYIFAAYFLTSFTINVYRFGVVFSEFFRCIFKIILYKEFALKSEFLHRLSCPKLINKMLEILYIFHLIFINVYMLVLWVIHWFIYLVISIKTL